MEVEKTEVQSIPQKRREYADIRKLAVGKKKKKKGWEEHYRVAKDEKAGSSQGSSIGAQVPHFVLPSS